MIARRWPATFAAAAALTACTGGPFRVDHTSTTTAIGGLGRSARFYSAFTDCRDFLDTAHDRAAESADLHRDVPARPTQS